MTECKTKFFDISVVKEWIGSAPTFIPKSLKPGNPGAPGDSKDNLTKWLVFQFQVMVIANIFGMIHAALAGAIVAGVTNAISGILSAWISAWFTWFAFAEREPSCCCILIGHIEGWKHMHLIMGILIILGAVSNVLNVLNAFLVVVNAGFDVADVNFIVYAVTVVIYFLYGLANLGVGLCLCKMGGKKSGVEVPSGAPAEQVGA